MASPAEQLTYILGTTNAEHDRLNRQACLIEKMTRHFLEEIGLRPGMRVLEVGSGGGDVSLLAAHMVGPEGQVVGVDLDGSAVELAQYRADREGLDNAQFQVSDFHDYTNAGTFDAVVGRCVLLHQRNPAMTLTSVARHVHSGGIVAFQEPWFSQTFSFPKMPLFEQVIGWLHSSVRASGLDGDIGLKLARIFVSAGLPGPKLGFEMLIDGSGAPELSEFVADTVRSLLPRLEQLQIVQSAHVRLDTLAERLRQEQVHFGAVMGIMPLMGAWCPKP